MKLDKLLTEFYKENGIPKNGGINKDTFEIDVFGINLHLPNPKFRKKFIYIHDIQHLLNKCDTSWKGEAFIAGWEISTGFWKYFPICIFSFWAMGYSFWLHPKAVINGFKKGLNNIGIVDLNISKSDFMKMEFEELQKITKKGQITEMRIAQWIEFIFWWIISQMIFLFPLIMIAIGTIGLTK
jgi:glycosyltransferase involved in cell wall biosynthesis